MTADELSHLFQVERKTFEWVPKGTFDELTKAGQWEAGPQISTFGQGDYEPYNPCRAIFGVLKGGRRIETNTKNDRTWKGA